MHDDDFFRLNQHAMSCIVAALVILHENYKLLCTKSTIRIKIKQAMLKQGCSGMAMQGWGMGWHTFSREGMHRASYSGNLLKSTYNDTNCSDTYTLHVCKLQSNSSDVLWLQPFPHFLLGQHPEVKQYLKWAEDRPGRAGSVFSLPGRARPGLIFSGIATG